MHLAPTTLPESLTDGPQPSQLSLIAASANEMVTQDGTGPLDVVEVWHALCPPDYSEYDSLMDCVCRMLPNSMPSFRALLSVPLCFRDQLR